MHIPHGNRWRAGWSNCIRRRGNGRLLQKPLEPGRREHKQIMVLNVAGIAQLVRDVARRNESITSLENKDLVSNSDFQFASQDVVNLILTRMRMTRYPHSWRKAYLQQAVLSSRIHTRKTYRTDAYVEVITITSRRS